MTRLQCIERYHQLSIKSRSSLEIETFTSRAKFLRVSGKFVRVSRSIVSRATRVENRDLRSRNPAESRWGGGGERMEEGSRRPEGKWGVAARRVKEKKRRKENSGHRTGGSRRAATAERGGRDRERERKRERTSLSISSSRVIRQTRVPPSRRRVAPKLTAIYPPRLL